MEWGRRVWNVMERKGEGGLVSGLRSGSKMGMVVRERGMAETYVMELGVGIPQIKGCCQWVLISVMSMIGM
ncbi:hypothetical protein ACFX1Z_004699 [Malus domestica]